MWTSISSKRRAAYRCLPEDSTVDYKGQAQARDGQTDSFRLRFSGASANVTAMLRRDLRLHTSAELTRVGQWQTIYDNGLETPLEEGERHCPTCLFPSTGTCPICTGGGGQVTRSGKRRER